VIRTPGFFFEITSVLTNMLYAANYMYGLAQMEHLKQSRSPACITNNEQAWLNSSLPISVYGSWGLSF